MKLIKEEILEGLKWKPQNKKMKENVKMSNFSYKKWYFNKIHLFLKPAMKIIKEEILEGMKMKTTKKWNERKMGGG